MKHIKKLLMLALVLCMALAVLPMSAEAEEYGTTGTCGENIDWMLSADGTLTISGIGAMDSYISADAVPWYSVRDSIKSAVIENGVTGIGAYAFADCNNLATVVIPSSLTSSGSRAFYHCGSMTDVYISDPSAWCKISFADAYANPLGNGNMSYNDSVNQLHILDESGNEMAEVILDDSVVVVPAHAFYKCKNLVSIVIPNSVTDIGGGAFYECRNLKTVTLGNSVTSIGHSAFSHCDNLERIDIPDSVTDLGANAFYSCMNLTQATVGNGVKIIGNSAFQYCENLESVTIGSSVNSIGDFAFGGCRRLIAIDLPDSLIGLGQGAFDSCEELKNIVIPENVINIGYRTFLGCSDLTEITIPDKAVSIGKEAFYNCLNLTNVTIGRSVTSIGEVAFLGCGKLTSIVIPKHVERLDSRSFAGCMGLKEITFEGDAPAISSDAFGASSSEGYNKVVATVYYPDNNSTWTSDVLQNYGGKLAWKPYTPEESGEDENEGGEDEGTVIASGQCGAGVAWKLNDSGKLTISGNGTMSSYLYGTTPWYEHRGMITSAVVEEGVSNIGGHSFDGCTVLQSIEIPSSVTNMGYAVFNMCDNLRSLYITDLAAWLEISNPHGSRPLQPDGKMYLNGELMTEVTVPESVTDICGYAFYNCGSLKSIKFLGPIENIGNAAFSGCGNLTSIEIPDGVIRIGGSAFYNCTSLTNVSIPNSVTQISAFAFYNCSALESITLPFGISSIGDYAFYDCTKLRTVTFEGAAPAFGMDVFTGVTATVNYPNNRSGWTSDVLQQYGGKLTWKPYTVETPITGTCGENLKWELKGEILTISGNGPMQNAEDPTVPGRKTSPWYDYRDAIKAVVIKEGVTTIGDYAFEDCANLPSITLPDSIISIGKDAFWKCSNLVSITFGKGTFTNTGGAFYECDSLKDVYISDPSAWCNSKIDMYSHPLQYSANLHILDENGNEVTSVVLNDSVKAIPHRAFKNSKLKSIVLPDGLTGIGEHAFENCTALTAIEIPDGVAYIDSDAFRNCSSLKSIEIPDNVTSMGRSTFGGCGSLTSAVIGNGVTSIGMYAFGDCNRLTSITLGNSVTSIGDSAFDNCISLTSIVLPDSVTRIDRTAFQACSNLTSITFGDGLTKIGERAFCQCKKLQDVVIPDSVVSIGNSAFAECRGLTSIKIPSGVTSIGLQTFLQCSGLASVELMDGVTCIGLNAFAGCSRLTSITIPASVTRIDGGAFIHCSRLKEITFEGNAPDISTEVNADKLGVFSGVAATAYYPFNNSTWTADVMQNYGGKLTWVAKCTKHTPVVEVAVEPTCTENGVSGTVSCSNCGELLAESEVIPALGHQWNKGVDAEGIRTYHCLRCDAIDTKQLPPADMTTAQPEISESLMDSILSDEEKEQVAAGETIEVYLDVTDKTDRMSETEIEQINKKLGEHEVGIYLDIDLYKQVGQSVPEKVTETKEKVSVSITIPEALRNSYPSVERNYGVIRVHEGVAEKLEGVFDSVTNIFTFETDSFSTYALTLDDTILPHEHSYEAVVQTPTCTEIGSTAHTCALCGDSYVTEEIAALGHDVTYEVETAPSLEAGGMLAGTCTRCGEKLTATLPKLSKTAYTLEVITEPTDEANGLGLYTWNVTDYGTFTFEAAIPNVILGDVNDDGAINVVDLMYLANYFAKGETINKANADVNNDGTVDVRDLMFLANVFAGKETLG